jgi:hypothetical protein
MRNRIPTWCLTLCCLACAGSGLAVQIKGVLLAPVKIAPGQMTVDSVLIDAATTSGVNIVCDTTGLDQHMDPTGMDGGPLGGVLVTLVRSKRLAITQTDERSFALWSLPDLPALMAQVREGACIETVEPKFTAAEWPAMLRKWVETTGDAAKPEVDIPLDDLPADLRSTVLAHAQSHLLARAGRGAEPIPGVFDAMFWDAARVWITETNDQGRKVTLFRFGTTHHAAGKAGRTIGWQM